MPLIRGGGWTDGALLAQPISTGSHPCVAPGRSITVDRWASQCVGPLGAITVSIVV